MNFRASALSLLLLTLPMLAAQQTSDLVQIERRGDSAVLSVNTFRPIDAIVTRLETEFGLVVSAEDPNVPFRGALPRRWGFELTFPVRANGSPQNIPSLLAEIAAEANRRSPFAYRLDEIDGTFFFVPTRTRDAQGRSIDATPLLDRPVTIPAGIRRINESAILMAADLSRQTGLRVNCCQSLIAGYPWGMEEVMFAANQEPARSVLRRLGLTHWHMRCDDKFCFIDMR